MFFAVLALCAVQVVYGIGPLFWLSQHLPFVEKLANNMAIGVLDLAIVVLGALGLTAVTESGPGSTGHERRRAAVVASAAVVGVLIAVTAARTPDGAPTPEWFRCLPSSGVLTVAAAALLLAAAAQRLRAAVLAAAAVTLVVLDVTSFAYGHVPHLAADDIYPQVPLLDELQRRDPGTWRMASVDGAYPPNLEMLYDLESATGYDFPTEAFADLIEPVAVPFISYYLESQRVVATDDSRLDLMNLKYLFVPAGSAADQRLTSRPDRFTPILDDGAVRIFENRRALPRAFLVPAGGCREVPSDAVSAELSAQHFNAATEVLMDTCITPTQPHPQAQLPDVQVVEAAGGRLRLELDEPSPQPALLVISQSPYPGWQANVDGADADVQTANAALQAIAIPAGARNVELHFRPNTFTWGIAGTVGTMVATTAMLVRRPGRGRRLGSSGHGARAATIGRVDAA